MNDGKIVQRRSDPIPKSVLKESDTQSLLRFARWLGINVDAFSPGTKKKTIVKQIAQHLKHSTSIPSVYGHFKG